MTIRSIETIANVILTFDNKPQEIYDAPLEITLPADKSQETLDRFEVDVVRQLLAPIDANKLDDLVKISVCYAMKGFESGRIIDLGADPEINDAINHLVRHNAKYYFQPDQRDDYEQRIVDELGVALRTRMFAPVSTH